MFHTKGCLPVFFPVQVCQDYIHLCHLCSVGDGCGYLSLHDYPTCERCRWGYGYLSLLSVDDFLLHERCRRWGCGFLDLLHVMSLMKFKDRKVYRYITALNHVENKQQTTKLHWREKQNKLNLLSCELILCYYFITFDPCCLVFKT